MNGRGNNPCRGSELCPQNIKFSTGRRKQLSAALASIKSPHDGFQELRRLIFSPLRNLNHVRALRIGDGVPIAQQIEIPESILDNPLVLLDNGRDKRRP